MGWLSKLRGGDAMDPARLLEQANASSPTGPAAANFQMPVADVFVISGRGVVATGEIEAGTVTLGSSVQIRRAGQVVSSSTITGIEQFRKRCTSATVGENVGLLLEGLTREDVASGDVIVG